MLSNRYQIVMQMLSNAIDKGVATMEKLDSAYKGATNKGEINGY